MRVCTTCLVAKTDDQFYKHPNYKNGIRSQCIACSRKKEKAKQGTAEYRAISFKSRVKHKEQLLYNGAKYRATEKGIAFDIDLHDIVIPKTCPVLGIPIVRDAHGRCDGSPTVDRRDNSLGYIKGNVFVISDLANRIKNCGTIADHEKIISFMKRPITEGPFYKPEEARPHLLRRLKVIKYRCRLAGLPYDLTPDMPIPRQCPVFGIDLLLHTSNECSRDASFSIDRLHPLRGYIKNNVAVISTLANTIKSSGTLDDHIKIVAYMSTATKPTPPRCRPVD